MFKPRAFKIILLLVALMFVAAYAKHRFIDRKLQPESNLKDKEMDEISGIAASSINPDLFYVHNDSGDTSRFFAIDKKGNLKSTIYFKGDYPRRGARDCEDIAVGPGPAKGKSYVYLGDIGDNYTRWKAVTIYRFAEIPAWASAGKTEATTTALKYRYPDGAKDAEAMAIDPLERLLYIVTKRGDSVNVYTGPLNIKAADTTTLTFRGKLFFEGSKPFKWITAADISKDGQQVLIKSYEKVYYWRRRGNEPLWQTLQRPARELTYKQERQGEAIGFTQDGKGYYTTSEGVFAPIYYYHSPN
ncbi:hypothetical protein D0C36_10745 [Mucilaginibacter conchicola]|uniref:Uncharacterized protein n=1 Tax=Mucilaginibacter conchicola TaxID=2303333 RepID=A0A372NRP5_9SPHI|nr:hypothetical protein [Mucilaginibacter conchicola]RFZ91918.1 hypothetical protein D0C36_10745 [Mucilaginibacter conchicola]